MKSKNHALSQNAQRVVLCKHIVLAGAVILERKQHIAISS